MVGSAVRVQMGTHLTFRSAGFGRGHQQARVIGGGGCVGHSPTFEGSDKKVRLTRR